MLDDYIGYTGAADVACKDLSDVPHNATWDTGDERELKMHRIHSYPAKFPAFITSKALEYARRKNVNVEKIADIFCGCGTVAFEAQREKLAFWGCDLNPVATLIARAKSHTYNTAWLHRYNTEIEASFKTVSRAVGLSRSASARLQYWFPDAQMRDLARLKNAILRTIPSESHYRDFFLCAFSNILKSTSRWLTKSIKPQLDPEKIPAKVLPAFQNQVKFMIRAFEECPPQSNAKTTISTSNFLSSSNNSIELVDMIITSPPYVTSYEYADLHQLSSLWLGFTEDYRDLRNGSIGSTQHDFNFNREVKRLNKSGTEIVFRLLSEDSRAAKSVAKYYLDMQQVALRCASVVRPKGLGVFVIGNTCYKGVPINNAGHLAEALLDAGFAKVSIAKRRITNKILTPYRTPAGRFTRSNSSANTEIYSEEFILIAER
ncbi:hypothetical protein [Collimonas pratensis]|uniref:site-specific DNA-methyltransferase (cytosine-N(4)-specific) n=1 Tax=Collimonas pratensis TaxID=279113 RepID=A0A127Q915_9BURK|nr:hypothetical protein [Collimonas pratensis]AMP06514.1 DNA methylase family protein [Collimonas pratensis]